MTTTSKDPSMKQSQNKPRRILLCSENVPPQVNGIARRIGHYSTGFESMGHSVEVLHPGCPEKAWSFVNPWNSTAQMMIIRPSYFCYLLSQKFDVVHCVLPLNFSGMWLLAAFKILRTLRGDYKPALVVSWHCNMHDYISYHAPILTTVFSNMMISSVCWILPHVSDRILTPTKSTDPLVTDLWSRGRGAARRGICPTGISADSFHPKRKESKEGQFWVQRKADFLQQTGRKYLLLCVGRLSPEKGLHDLLRTLVKMPDCALWLVGDGASRASLESLAEELNVTVQFWGYQTGDALYSVYTVADLFVCPSLTETYGQAVNEALASEVRVALPDVPVFTEAYSEYLPADAFWKAGDSSSMVRAIEKQLSRHASNDPVGIPDRRKLRTWNDACSSTFSEYMQASLAMVTDLDLLFVKKRVLFFLFPWVLYTVFHAFAVFLFSVLRK